MKRILALISVISLLITSTACSTGVTYDVSNISEYVLDGSSKFAFDILKPSTVRMRMVTFLFRHLASPLL